MTTVTGQLTFVIRKVKTTLTEYVTVESSEFDIESEQTDIEDDKRRESIYLAIHGTAFDGDANFTVRLFYDVFGLNVFQHSLSIEYITEGYILAVATDEPDDGLTVEATPVRNEH